MQRIDVNERIVGLERLNPTPRPTTSAFLSSILNYFLNTKIVLTSFKTWFRAPVFEGQWKFEWFGSSSPGLLAAKVLFQYVCFGSSS